MSDNFQQSNGDFIENYPSVNRFEVIDNNGRVYTNYDISKVQVSLQDDGRTLKVFLEYEDYTDEQIEEWDREDFGNLPDAFYLSPEEIEELRKSKRELSEYAQEKIRKLMKNYD